MEVEEYIEVMEEYDITDDEEEEASDIGEKE